ncbi:MAG: Hsp33 family molecular chaperone HslO [bacterium]|nr:Hsp33 family molecular chaperone HslO [bacterium]
MDEMKKRWTERDRVTKCITKDGMFRAACIHNVTCVRTAQERHALEPLRALMLARGLTSASLMASFLKGEERIAIDMTGDGPVRRVFTEALQVGEVRGFAVLNSEPDPEAKSPLGNGLLKVQRVLYGKHEPITGIVELRRGDVTSDLSYYLTQSEQIPSTFVLDVEFDDKDIITQSAGLLIQAMPGARPEDIFRVYDTIDYLGRLTQFINDGYSAEDILRQVLPSEVEIMGTSPVDFFCRCSMDKFKGMLLTLGYEEIAGMEREGHTELVCQYCNNRYHLTEADFAELKMQLLVPRN